FLLLSATLTSKPHAGQSTAFLGTLSAASTVPVINRPRPGRINIIDTIIITPTNISKRPRITAIVRKTFPAEGAGSSTVSTSILFDSFFMIHSSYNFNPIISTNYLHVYTYRKIPFSHTFALHIFTLKIKRFKFYVRI